ncbi:MAG: geranylgeranyl reductase family protein [Aquificae bacterium]|nr:geranylgeranyl reductase family protein [Aquificota bacterium]
MFDAAVVGAGPAGATVARLLAQKGLKVLLLEKARPPRQKLCAGAVSLRADGFLPPGWENAVLNEVYGGNLGWRGERYVSARSAKPVVKIVDRASFDLFLTLKAEDAGATVRFGERFLNFRRSDGGFEVVTDRTTYRARYLIGADGALSTVLRAWGARPRAVAVVEAVVETERAPSDEVFIDLGLVKWGYAWIFPKGEGRASVGLATLKGEVKNLRSLLEDYLSSHPLLKDARVSSLRGWFIPPSRGFVLKGEGNLLLVGDASGATDALLGEGIYYAVRQAHILASCLPSEKPLACYKKSLKPLEREFLFAYLTGLLAYNFQRFMFERAKEEDLLFFFGLLRGERGYREVFFYGLKRFLRSLLPFL